MKTYRRLSAFISLFVISSTLSLFAQGNMGINYQAVLRDAQGNLLQNTPIDVKFELYVQGQPVAYSETHSGVATDGFGSFFRVIGTGTRAVPSVSLSNLDFRSTWYWVKVSFKRSTDPTWIVISDQPLQAVPYALNAYEPPIGTIQQFAGTKEYFNRVLKPQGWRLCNGDQVDTGGTDANRALFDAMHYSWGMGDGNNRSKLRLPDLRGRFLRAVDDGAGIDQDTSSRYRYSPGESYLGDRVGSLQPDAFQGHVHSDVYTKVGSYVLGSSNDPYEHGAYSTTGGEKPNEVGAGLPVDPSKIPGSFPPGWSSYGIPRLSKETRPQNAYVYMIVFVGRGVK
jgi:hypothetical protein